MYARYGIPVVFFVTAAWYQDYYHMVMMTAKDAKAAKDCRSGWLGARRPALK